MVGPGLGGDSLAPDCDTDRETELRNNEQLDTALMDVLVRHRQSTGGSEGTYCDQMVTQSHSSHRTVTTPRPGKMD